MIKYLYIDPWVINKLQIAESPDKVLLPWSNQGGIKTGETLRTIGVIIPGSNDPTCKIQKTQ